MLFVCVCALTVCATCATVSAQDYSTDYPNVYNSGSPLWFRCTVEGRGEYVVLIDPNTNSQSFGFDNPKGYNLINNTGETINGRAYKLNDDTGYLVRFPSYYCMQFKVANNNPQYVWEDVYITDITASTIDFIDYHGTRGNDNLSFVFGLNSLTASAASQAVAITPDYFELVDCYLDSYTSSEEIGWEAPRTVSFTAKSVSMGNLGLVGVNYVKGWRAKFKPLSSAGSMAVQPYFRLSCNFFYSLISSDNYSGQTITGAMYLTLPDGKILEFPVIESIPATDEEGHLTGYTVQVGGSASVSEAFETGDCTFEFVMTGISNLRTVSVDFYTMNLTAVDGDIADSTVQIVDSIEQGFEELKQNQDKNTQDIIDNDNVNAEKTHGFLQSIWDSIVALPGKIWSLIENGLKALFVPDQEYIQGYKDKWDTLLSSRFGAVYEASDIMISWVGGISDAAASGTIEFPEVSIPMPDNNRFTFGPYVVDIVPNGFESIAKVSKTITSVVAVLFLINALRKRGRKS